MFLKKGRDELGVYFVDHRKNRWYVKSRRRATLLARSLENCYNCIDCYNCVNCNACISSYNCINCKTVVNCSYLQDSETEYKKWNKKEFIFKEKLRNTLMNIHASGFQNEYSFSKISIKDL